MLVRGVQGRFGGHYVVRHLVLTDLLVAEQLGGVQVEAIVVFQEVKVSDRPQLDAGIDQEVDESRLHLGLARLEVVAADEGFPALGREVELG